MRVTPSRPHAGDIQGIQYLRGVAAAMVVLHHARHYFGPAADAWTTVGSDGVDLFFVISGFIMAHTTAGFDPAVARGTQAADFMLRRAVRVIPLYWLVLALWALDQLRQGTIDPVLWKDFLFIARESMVAPGHAWPLLVPGWTINYEIFFYLLFGTTMLLGRHHLRYLCGLLVALCALGMLWRPDALVASFYTDSLLLEFVAGILLYRFLQHAPDPPSRTLLWAVLLSAAAALALGFNGLPSGITDVVPAGAILWASVHLFQNRPIGWLRLLGDASYSIYLTHLFSFKLARRLCDALGLAVPAPSNIALALCLHLAVAAGLGLAVHAWLERPLTQGLRRWLAHRRPQRRVAL